MVDYRLPSHLQTTSGIEVEENVIDINGETTVHLVVVVMIELENHLYDYDSLMNNTISSTTSGKTNRPRLCRSDHQPNMLEYIDTTLNDSLFSRLKIQSTTTTKTLIPNGSDQFGNTVVDQYLLSILCQKLNPNRTDHQTEQLYHSLHELFLCHGQISKSFFEYSPSMTNQSIFQNYTNFIWNEFDLDVLLELACFLLKYRLRDIFINVNSNHQKFIGYFLEIIAIYYLVTNHQDYFLNSRAKEMLFPYPPVTLSNLDDEQKKKDISIFDKFLRKISDNGEIRFDLRQMRILFQSDAYQFIHKKLENKKIAFSNFFHTILRYQQENACRSLKSLCRLSIKMHIKQYPNDIKQFALYPSINDELLKYLTYENTYVLPSFR